MHVIWRCEWGAKKHALYLSRLALKTHCQRILDCRLWLGELILWNRKHTTFVQSFFFVTMYFQRIFYNKQLYRLVHSNSTIFHCLFTIDKQICLIHYTNHSAHVKIRVCQYGSQTRRRFFNRFDVFKCIILSPLSGKELIYFQHSTFVTNLCGILVSFKTVANCFHPQGFDILFRSNALIKSTIWVLGRTEPFNVNSPFGLHVMSECFLMCDNIFASWDLQRLGTVSSTNSSILQLSLSLPALSSTSAVGMIFEKLDDEYSLSFSSPTSESLPSISTLSVNLFTSTCGLADVSKGTTMFMERGHCGGCFSAYSRSCLRSVDETISPVALIFIRP